MREVLLISHELRTPLTVLSGYLDLLDQHDFPPEERRRIRRHMRDAVTELERTIEVLIERERRAAVAYGLTIPELVEPALYRSRDEILSGAASPVEPAGRTASEPGA